MLERLGLRGVLLAASAALVALGLVLMMTAPEPEQRGAVGAQAALRKVETQRVESRPVTAHTEVSGILEARRSIEIFSETRGPVTAVGAEEMDPVEAGQLLALVDPLLAQVAVEQGEAAVARTRSQLALAQSNLERRRRLFEQGVVSDAELDDAENAGRVASAALREARAALTQARDELAKKTIRAPFAGVLRSFSVEVGEYVQDGQRLGELLDVETVRVNVGLADREIVAVRPGGSVRVHVEAYPDRRFDGRVLRVGAAADAQTRKFPVEVELPNPEGALLPGMVAGVEIGLGEPELRTLIPRDATLDEFGLRFVYVVEADGDAHVARRRRVGLRPVPFRPTDLEVVSGLAPGERIAISAVRELRDGEAVAVRNGDGSP
jgi:RND family efflux transporter MFP subunit